MTPGLETVLVMAGAFAAGAVNSTVGGGGLIQLPALVAAYPNWAPATLLGTNKLASLAGTGSAVARYSRHLAIPWRVVLPGAAMAFVASLAGATVVRHLTADMFRPLVPIMLALMLAYVLLQKELGSVHAPKPLDRNVALPAALAFVALGFFDGFFGPGVGSFLILVFVRLLGYDFLHAAASARFINFSSNAAAVAYFGSHGNISWLLAVAMAASNVLGSQAGTAWAVRHGSRRIRSVFIVIVCTLILKTAWDAWQAIR